MRRKNLKSANLSKDIQLPNEKIKEILSKDYYNKEMRKIDNADVTINHLENIFTDETYYLAMKMVPFIERKVLYLAYVGNARLNDICRRLKISKKEVIKLRNQGINHFKNNLKFLYKAEKLKRGKKDEKKI